MIDVENAGYEGKVNLPKQLPEGLDTETHRPEPVKAVKPKSKNFFIKAGIMWKIQFEGGVAL